MEGEREQSKSDKNPNKSKKGNEMVQEEKHNSLLCNNLQEEKAHTRVHWEMIRDKKCKLYYNCGKGTIKFMIKAIPSIQVWLNSAE